jgi:hypothetical protein
MLGSGLLTAGLLVIPLAGCSGTNNGSSVISSASSAASSAAGSAGSAASSAANAASSKVDCSGSSCSVTLSGNSKQATVLGTTIKLGSVQNGKATVSVGDRSVSCGQGDSVSAGPLTLKCTTVSDNSVTLTASL